MTNDVKTQHTPGPWSIDESHGQYSVIAPPVEGSAFPRAYVCDLTYREGNEANARLIAAAPDMLEVLKRCKNTLAGLLPQPEKSPLYLDVVKVIEQVETGQNE